MRLWLISTTMHAALKPFHPELAAWFQEEVGEPTDVQSRAWPRIARGEHVLVTAPTGSGKTLTAFFSALNNLLSGSWPSGALSVLYVSPLRALNSDIARNLIGPLASLRQRFHDKGLATPDVQVMTRSGDTSAAQRRAMIRRPPEILITTPEGLNLLLTSRSGLDMLIGLRCVILDEIHALVDSKRGTHLMTAVERMVRHFGEFQRIALSATVHPIAKVSRFAGGYRRSDGGQEPRYEARELTFVRSDLRKKYAIDICLPDVPHGAAPSDDTWEPLCRELFSRIEKNRSTLIFVDSRRMAEKITRLINEAAGEMVAYAHHGSLAREIRLDVEARLKAGSLKAIVATSSLEMGIDIGSIDEVIQLFPPPSAAAAIQRAGRSGHQVGNVSRTTFYGVTAQQLIESTVIAQSIREHRLEAVSPIEAPLDVLAQVILSMTALETRHVDDLYAEIRSCAAYQDLPREHFDLVVEMLAGRYSDSKVRDLKPKIAYDRLDHTIAARPGVVQEIYRSGGTIPNRGEYQLRHHESSAPIGSLDEEFVWEAKIGDNFLFGTQSWQIQAITHNDVFVTPSGQRGRIPPFWRSESQNRTFHLSQHLGLFLEQADLALDQKNLEDWLKQGFALDERVAREISDFLEAQRQATRSHLPHRHHLLIEHVTRGPKGAPGYQTILHTFWGGRVNRPFALAFEAAWEAEFGQRPEVFVSNDAIAVQVADHSDPELLLDLVRPDNFEKLIRKRLEGSGFFGARFREAAGRALLLPKRKFSERLPLWMTRLRSQQLFDSVRDYGDFPIVLETWRTCLHDEFDLESLHTVLTELENRSIRVSASKTTGASPMGKSLSWAQISDYMYRDDTPNLPSPPPSLNHDLIANVALSADRRPAIAAAICRAFEAKVQRSESGYEPRSCEERFEWLKDRLCIAEWEWRQLDERFESAFASDPRRDFYAAKIVRIADPKEDRGRAVYVALEFLPLLVPAFYAGAAADLKACTLHDRQVIDLAPYCRDPVRLEDASTRFAEVLTAYGPQTVAHLANTLLIDEITVDRWVDELLAREILIRGPLVADSDETWICDRRNFERLLRLSRSQARPQVEALHSSYLAPFLAATQGVGGHEYESDRSSIKACVESLLGLPLTAALWEREVFPARSAGYRKETLDLVVSDAQFVWVGQSNERLLFAASAEVALCRGDDDALEPKTATDLRADETANDRTCAPAQDWRVLFRDPDASYDFAALHRTSSLSIHEIWSRLWAGVWAGEITCDRFSAVRHGLELGFAATPGIAELGAKRAPRQRGMRTPILAGHWRLLPCARDDQGIDALAREENNKERVRLLIGRYGILFRQLLSRENPAFQWRLLFRTMRLMELSGELVAGHFFQGIDSLQFMSPAAFRRFEQRQFAQSTFWINACDPASTCGLSFTDDERPVPRRVMSTHLVYDATNVVMVVRRNGKELEIAVAADHPKLGDYFEVLRHLLRRDVGAMPRLAVDAINGHPARSSPYVDALRRHFDLSLGPHDLTLAISRH
jgi:ATP-dependent Lhr-like helicase